MSNVDPTRSEDWVGAVDRRVARVRSESQPREPSAEDRVARSAVSIAALGIVATVAGRWLPRGLPGSAAGIDRLIAWAAGTGAFVTQLFVLLGAALALRLVQLAVSSPRLMVAWRFGCPALSLAALLIVLTATEDRLEPSVALVLASLVIVVALAVTALLVVSRGTRAVGIVLGFAALAALSRLAFLALAAHADRRGAPVTWFVASGASTLAFVADVASIAVLAVWLRATNARRWTVVFGALTLAALVLAVAVARARDPGAAAWQVVLLRSLEQTHAAPVPLVPRLAIEGFAFALACATLFFPERPRVLCALASLALSARAAADVPALSLCLLLAALLGLVSAAAPSATPTPS
jgi:hypothetical protein